MRPLLAVLLPLMVDRMDRGLVGTTPVRQAQYPFGGRAGTQQRDVLCGSETAADSGTIQQKGASWQVS